MTENGNTTVEQKSLTTLAWGLYNILQNQGRISLHDMHELASRIEQKGKEYRKTKLKLAAHVSMIYEIDECTKRKIMNTDDLAEIIDRLTQRLRVIDGL